MEGRLERTGVCVREVTAKCLKGGKRLQTIYNEKYRGYGWLPLADNGLGQRDGEKSPDHDGEKALKLEFNRLNKNKFKKTNLNSTG